MNTEEKKAPKELGNSVTRQLGNSTDTEERKARKTRSFRQPRQLGNLGNSETSATWQHGNLGNPGNPGNLHTFPTKVIAGLRSSAS